MANGHIQTHAEGNHEGMGNNKTIQAHLRGQVPEDLTAVVSAKWILNVVKPLIVASCFQNLNICFKPTAKWKCLAIPFQPCNFS